MADSKHHISLAICSGCGIGEAVDVPKLLEMASAEHPGVSCMSHPSLCSEAGLSELNQFSQKNQTGQLTVAACSPRAKAEQFKLDQIYVDRANLREQVAWVMEAMDEDTQMCAEDQIRMSLAKLGSISDVQSYVPEELSSEILVVGGGVSGLSAALEGVAAGYKIHLVEKGDQLGGYAGRVHKLLPASGESEKLREPDVIESAARVLEHPDISVYLNSTIKEVSGEPGNFNVTLENQDKAGFKVGSMVMATGWSPYDAQNLDHLGYGSGSNIKTLEEFEAHVQKHEVPDRILFVMCAGSRDEKHLPYCSAYCCGAALKQALYIREKNPASQVYIIYRDIRTPGFQEEFYKQVQSDDSILLTKGNVDSVREEGGTLKVTISDSLVEDQMLIESDMVVLATGMKPSASEDLQLQYRLGKGIPSIEYDFSDSHFICFPYETRRTGIYAAGTVRAPMEIQASVEDGAGAMMKAIQCIACVRRGEAVHPRAGDQTFPELYMERCTDCKRCTEECPFGSYDENEKGTPLPNPARCRRCGICVGSCPERVIGFADYSINSVSAMIKSIHVPDEFDEKSTLR